MAACPQLFVMIEMIEMRQHGAASAAPADGKFVLSALPPGESAVHATSRSIKIVIEGEEVHEIDGRPYIVRPGQMLLVDRGAPSRAIVRRNRQTLGLCVYLPTLGSGPLEDDFLPRAILQATDSNPLGRMLADHAACFHRGSSNIASRRPVRYSTAP